MTDKVIAVVAGTRPEFIKLTPVVNALRARLGEKAVKVLSTGQHRSLLAQAIDALKLHVDVDFDLMTHAQSPAEIQRRILSACDHAWRDHKPDMVIVQGDTISAMAGANAAWLNQIPVVHVEAGLRSFDMQNPWPEEGLRQMIARIATWHLAPTETARQNLINEGVAADCIQIVGNPGIDSLESAMQASEAPMMPAGLDTAKPFAIVTIHRREAIGEPMRQFCRALKKVIAQKPDLQVIWPLHPNPAVRDIIAGELGHPGASPILFVDPLPYPDMARLLPKASIVISDSGGMQEEAPYCGVPIAVMRDTTERPEILDLGLGVLAGANGRDLLSAMDKLQKDSLDHVAIARWRDIQGNGASSTRIADFLGNLIKG